MKRASCRAWVSLQDEQALGRVLTSEDSAFLRRHAGECDDCAREAELWSSTLPGLVADRPIDAAELELLEQQVIATWSQTLPPPPWWRRQRVAIGLASAALAAAAAMVIGLGPWRSPAAPAAARAAVESSGRSLVQGQSLGAGASVECLAIDAGVRACLAPQSRVTFAASRATHRVLSLDSGRVVTRLAPQPAGARFSVRAGGWTITAVGTVFAVEQQDAAIRVRALEGTIAIEDRAGHTFRVTAPAAVDLTDTSTLVPLSATLAEGDWGLLRGERPSPAPAAPEATPERPDPVEVSDDIERPRTPRPSASVLLQRARALRAEGRYAEAAATYRQLQAGHAGSGAAQVALLSLGELQLSQLGDPQGALRSFQAYLDARGTLVQEARYGKIRALRSLGRAAEERREIEQFLARHPKSVQAPGLRARLEQL
ncbi:MAG TPA: FecR domain-containing protein [Polyangiaceae bacterium]|nr:FecR domain-containing protein [Polyangiaceae bacterium]